MQPIGKLLLGALLLIFGLLTLGMGVCATAYTAETSGISLLFGLPVTALLGFIAHLLWGALRGTARGPSAKAGDDNTP